MPGNERLLDIYQFPEQLDEFKTDWDVVFLPDQTKDLLLDYVFTLARLGRANATGLALRRAVLLYGPPGCGKTSLARGLPARWFAVARETKAGFIHVNTHALFSGERGGGQRKILEAFRQISEHATGGFPIFVLIDEIETLGTDRSSISFEANPLDALYQVTAFFESFDKMARTQPNVVFIFTTNIPKAIDRAVRERVDFSVEIPLPDRIRRSMILASAVHSLSSVFDVSGLTRMAMGHPPDPAWLDVVDQAEGLSGRALRHVLVLAATFAARSQTLDLSHLRRAISQVRDVEEGLVAAGGGYLERYQQPGNAAPSGRELPGPPLALPPAPDLLSGVHHRLGSTDAGNGVPLGVRLDEEIADLRGEVHQMRAMLQGALARPGAEARSDVAPLKHAKKNWLMFWRRP
jgi:SpoVK/Ycf46/Vps4 family AAA+-type ATPase